MKPIRLFLLVSILLHGVFWGVLFLFPDCGQIFWGGGNSKINPSVSDGVWIDLKATGNNSEQFVKLEPDSKKRPIVNSDSQTQTNKNPTNENPTGPVSQGGEGVSATSQGGKGDGIDSSQGSSRPSVLDKIRQRIMARKYYPQMAKDQGLEGDVDLIFEINESGAIKSAVVSKSSGHKLLDEASLTTLKRAVPYPLYEGPVEITLRFDLEDNVW